MAPPARLANLWVVPGLTGGLLAISQTTSGAVTAIATVALATATDVIWNGRGRTRGPT